MKIIFIENFQVHIANWKSNIENPPKVAVLSLITSQSKKPKLRDQFKLSSSEKPKKKFPLSQWKTHKVWGQFSVVFVTIIIASFALSVDLSDLTIHSSQCQFSVARVERVWKAFKAVKLRFFFKGCLDQNIYHLLVVNFMAVHALASSIISHNTQQRTNTKK